MAHRALMLCALLIGCGRAPVPASSPAHAQAPAVAPVVASAPSPTSPPEPRDRVLVAPTPDPGVAPPSEARPRAIVGSPCSIVFARTPLSRIARTAAPAAAPAVSPSLSPTAHWRQHHIVRLGISHLTIADISADGRHALVVSENDARLRIVELSTGKLLADNPVAGYASWGRGDFAFWPVPSDPPRVVFASERGIVLLDGLSARPIATLSDEPAWEIRWTNDGRILGASLARIPAQTSRIAFFELVSERLEPALVIESTRRIDGWDLTHNATRLAISLYPGAEIELLDLDAARAVWTRPAPEYSRSVDISPDDRLVAVGGDRVLVVEADNPGKEATYAAFDNNIHQVRFSPSGDALSASAYDGRLRLLAVQTEPLRLTRVAELRHAGTANVYAALFAPDGLTLVSTSGDQTLRIWGP